MIKLTTIYRPSGPAWHLLLSPLPADWFVGERHWPDVSRPVLLLKGYGPVHLRRYLTSDEIAARISPQQSAPFGLS